MGRYEEVTGRGYKVSNTDRTKEPMKGETDKVFHKPDGHVTLHPDGSVNKTEYTNKGNERKQIVPPNKKS